MGSWDAFVTNIVDQSRDPEGVPGIESACIFSLKSGLLYNTEECPNLLTLSASERILLARVLRRKEYNAFQSSGIKCVGKTYYLVKAHRHLVFGTKDGEGTVTLRETDTAVVAAFAKQDSDQDCNSTALRVVTRFLKKWERGCDADDTSSEDVDLLTKTDSAKESETTEDDLSDFDDKSQGMVYNNECKTGKVEENVGFINNSFKTEMHKSNEFNHTVDFNTNWTSEIDQSKRAIINSGAISDADEKEANSADDSSDTDDSEKSDETLKNEAIFDETMTDSVFGSMPDDYDTDIDSELEGHYVVNRSEFSDETVSLSSLTRKYEPDAISQMSLRSEDFQTNADTRYSKSGGNPMYSLALN